MSLLFSHYYRFVVGFCVSMISRWWLCCGQPCLWILNCMISERISAGGRNCSDASKRNAYLPDGEETLNFILAIPNTGVCQRHFRGIRTQGQTTACGTVEVQKWNHILPSDSYCCWLVYAMYCGFAFLIRFCGCCKVMTSRETIVLL